MRIPIPAQYRRFQIRLQLTADRPLQLGVVVRDPFHAHTVYLRRKAQITERGRELRLSFPVSPAELELHLYDKSNGRSTGFTVQDLKITPLAQPQLWASASQYRFLEFALRFAQQAGYIPTGFYDSPKQEFLFQYLPTITDAMGTELITPARTNQTMPRVQISKRLFKGMTIPVRMAILLHEGCHWFLNTRSQTTADQCGLKQYLDYGFPKIEAVYAMTTIFGKYPDLVGSPQLQRTRAVIEFIEAYS